MVSFSQPRWKHGLTWAFQQIKTGYSSRSRVKCVPREMPNATLFLVAVLSRGPFNSSWSGDGNLWKQDKRGEDYPAPSPFFSFTLEATILEVGRSESHSWTRNYLLLLLDFVLGSGRLKKRNLMIWSQNTFEMFPLAVILNVSGLLKQSVAMPFVVSKTTLY